MTLDYTHVSSPADPADCTALLATWLERRLDSTTSWELDEARLYGITIRDGALLVEDADPAARFCLLDRGYPYDLLEGPAGLLAGNFDAAALLTMGWQAPFEADGTLAHRPARHPGRVRVRVVSVVLIDPVPGASAAAAAVRVKGQSEARIHTDGEGRMVDAMVNFAAEVLATRLAA